MISSMTGFGAADGNLGDARASVEIRTVNHRFFSPNLKLPSALSRWENEIREVLRQKIARGHVTLTARVDRAGGAGPVIDEARLVEYAVALREIQRSHALGGEVRSRDSTAPSRRGCIGWRGGAGRQCWRSAGRDRQQSRGQSYFHASG